MVLSFIQDVRAGEGVCQTCRRWCRPDEQGVQAMVSARRAGRAGDGVGQTEQGGAGDGRSDGAGCVTSSKQAAG